MNFYIHQEVTVRQIEVSAVSNSSVFQIGNTAEIFTLSSLFNTGQFTGPAPLTTEEYTQVEPPKKEVIEGSGLPA